MKFIIIFLILTISIPCFSDEVCKSDPKPAWCPVDDISKVPDSADWGATASVAEKSVTQVAQTTETPQPPTISDGKGVAKLVTAINGQELEANDPFCEEDEEMLEEKSVVSRGYEAIAQSTSSSVSQRGSRSSSGRTGNISSSDRSLASVPQSTNVGSNLDTQLNSQNNTSASSLASSQNNSSQKNNVSKKNVSSSNTASLENSNNASLVSSNISAGATKTKPNGSDGGVNTNLSQTNTSLLSSTNLSTTKTSNKSSSKKEGGVEVVSLNRRPKNILRVITKEGEKPIHEKMKRLIDAYNEGEFKGDELYIRNKDLGYVKIDDFVEDDFMLVEMIDDKIGKSSWKVISAKDLMAHSIVSDDSKELFAQRDSDFPRSIKRSKNLGKEEFSKFKGKGYEMEFIQGLDESNSLVALAKKIRKAHPTRTHIGDLEQFIHEHLDFMRRGFQSQDLEVLSAEAHERIGNKELTYLWWINWNYKLAQVASGKKADTMSFLSSLSFPETILLPTIHQIGMIGKNRTYVTDIQMVRLMNKKDQKGKLPSEIFAQDMGSQYFVNKDQKLVDTYIKRNFKELSVAERQIIEEQYFHRFYSKPQRKVSQQKI